MPRPASLYRRMAVFSLCSAILLASVAPSYADPKPLTKQEQGRIEMAIEAGVEFFKGTQTEEGDWKGKMYKDGRFPVGQCALPAYALLEAGVSIEDAVIRKAAEYLRPKALQTDYTYELALAILFLDRLGDPSDKALIQTMAIRLIAGQHQTGGWSYRCPLLIEKNERVLLSAVGDLSERMKGRDKRREQARKALEVPPALRSLTVFQSAETLLWREPPESPQTWDEAAKRVSFLGRTDNSNTQFAMLGLWAGQRHGVSAEPTFAIVVERFERSQGYPSGVWGYGMDQEAGTRSMICAGLMGLAIGRGLRLSTPGSTADGEKDVHVLKGLAALRRFIGRPATERNKRPPLRDLYFLWSLERVAMLYNLPAIGEKDWYRWGVESLLANQSKNGGWTGASPHPEWAGKKNYDYGPTLSTAFALLFLKRSHPMKELTPKLPFAAKELNEGMARLRPDERFPLRPAPSSGPSRSPMP